MTLQVFVLFPVLQIRSHTSLLHFQVSNRFLDPLKLRNRWISNHAHKRNEKKGFIVYCYIVFIVSVLLINAVNGFYHNILISYKLTVLLCMHLVIVLLVVQYALNLQSVQFMKKIKIKWIPLSLLCAILYITYHRESKMIKLNCVFLILIGCNDSALLLS